MTGTSEETCRILVVEDEADLRRYVAEYLAMQGFQVDQAEDGRAMRERLATGSFDLVLLDLRLPGEDGLALLRELRRAGDLPVIMVTAMGDPVDRVVGLELGADDYLVKPVEFRELLARIRTVLRRARRAPATASPHATVPVGRARFDVEGRRLFEVDGTEIALTRMEYDLLLVFVHRPHRVLSRDQLLELAHDDSYEPFDRSIDLRIARLRKKIEHDPARPEAIRTVRGSGYMFVP